MAEAEREDNWELVVTGADLTNNRIKIEDPSLNCALVREIGTDQATPVVFGVRDNPYMTIDNFIAPYYNASNNMNKMRLSEKKGAAWKFTGFELPIALDKEIEITGLESAKRLYMKGTLYRNVLSTDHPINKWMMSRMIEHSYKQLRPLYWKDVVIPGGLTTNKEFVLDEASPTELVAWDASNPKYTIDPSKNIRYNLRNTIQVLWNEEVALPKDIEFRLKHNNVDLKVQPRLDHMFFPPSDGASRYVTETLYMKSISDCETAWTAGSGAVVSPEIVIKKEGTKSQKVVADGATIAAGAIAAYSTLGAAVDISLFDRVGFWIGAVGAAIVDGGLTLLLDDTAACATPIQEITMPYVPVATDAAGLKYMILPLKTPLSMSAIASVGIRNSAVGAIAENNGFYIDDIRPLPIKVSHNPMEELVSAVFTGGDAGAVGSVNYANGEIAITYEDIPTKLDVGYYAYRSGGGRDIFTLRNLARTYHTLTYPNKQSYVFKNKGAGTPTGAKTATLYTLAEYYQDIPPEQAIPQNVFNAAMRWLL